MLSSEAVDEAEAEGGAEVVVEALASLLWGGGHRLRQMLVINLATNCNWKYRDVKNHAPFVMITLSLSHFTSR